MSAIGMERRDPTTQNAPWSDRARLATLARRHGLLAGLAVGVGALLRLWWLGDTSFLGDQAQLLEVARSAAAHGALILTGIPSSLGSLNPPASTWIYGLFALLDGPIVAAIFTALANVIAVALVYAIGARYVSRGAGFAGALLYATASGPVQFSRFIWQQNLLAPVVLLLFWMVLRGVLERWHGWLAWSALLWLVATELHPTAAPLLALIGVALLFTWRDLRRRDIVWTGVALSGLLAPTLIWEVVSHGFDLVGAQKFTSGKPALDARAVQMIFELVSPAPPGWYGAASSYVAVGRALLPLGVIVVGLVIALQVWLAGAVAWPWLAPHLQRPLPDAYTTTTDPRWRFVLLLAVWEVAPMLLMLRHTRSVVEAYLLVVLPAVYIGLGALLVWASHWLRLLLNRWPVSAAHSGELAVSVSLVALFALSGAQTVGVVSELQTLHNGQFVALTLPLHYGTPLPDAVKVLARTQAEAARLHATVNIASTRVEQEPLGYLNETSGAGLPVTDYISDTCLALPSASAHTPQVTLVVPDTTASQLLPQVDGARQIDRIPVQGGAPYTLHTIAPGATLAGERSLAAAGTSSGPRAAAYRYVSMPDGHLALALHWVGAPTLPPSGASGVTYWYGADPRGAPIANYTVIAQPLDAHGAPLGSPIRSVCGRLAWTSQLDVVTTSPLSTTLASSGKLAGWRISLVMDPALTIRPTIGPLSLETGAVTFGPDRTISQPVHFTATAP